MMNRRRNVLHKCWIILVILCFPDDGFCLQTDTINTTLVLRDPETISSSGKQFTLGFFTPNGTGLRYMGIWYYASPSAVAWVANRENPLHDSRGSISISPGGNLVLLDGDNQVVWETNTSSASPSNSTIARISDSGDLVLTDTSSSGTLWESHSHPVDTFLPGMKVSHNPKTGARVGLSSWRSFDNPGRGNFTAGLDAVGIPQIYIWENGVPRWRSGPWDGRVLTGVTGMLSSEYRDGLTLEIEDDDTYYFTRNSRPGYILRKFLNADGVLVQTVWAEQRNQWNVTWTAPANECDYYNKCGPNSVCYVHGNPICSCLRGYVPRNVEDWNRGTWSEGCVRRSLLQCQRDENATDKNREDKFSRLTFIKVPDHMLWTSGLETDCSPLCLRNCSCLAYAFIAGTGCMFWSGDLIDIQQFAGDAGSDFYARVAYWEVDQVNRKSKLVVIVVSVVACLVSLSVFLFLSWWIFKRTRKHKKSLQGRGDKGRMDSKEMDKIEELPLFRFEMLATATNQFALSNKLGEGGFGPVYKGKLENGNEIAVKRLSAASGQGYEEFMNEVLVISKLQHRNLVRLFGCCVERAEKLLVYEFLPNGSLDVLLFDTTQQVLDWKKRLNIIEGIGRGLLYLHRDSRLKIIHRDMKPSNILLDQDWNPKISDFGMAKIFGGNQDQANTGKVVGTYGYMAPEYALGGRFSEKSDVFSFGVLVLEIISGRKNTSFYNDEFALGLLGYAWKLWNEENVEELIDMRISSPSAVPEIIRCLHIGLLCVQEYPVIRPTMSMVLSMLSSEIVDLLPPEHPGFTERWSRSHAVPVSPVEDGSVNYLTQTAIEGR